MEKTSKTIVFFGNERLATGVTTSAPTLRSLIAAGYNVAAVVANYEQGRSRKARDLEIAGVAQDHNIPLLLPSHPREITEQLKSYGAQAGVLVAYGKIVPEETINIFPRGIVNIHPSLLPLHRGPTPIESVILEGANKTGVSLMQLVKAMDAGPVYAQTEHALSGNESKQDLADNLLRLGGELLITHLPAILDGSTKPAMQDETKATYDQLITKNDSIIDWHKPAQQLEREIRAYKGWPGSRTTLANKDVVITSAEITPVELPAGKVSVVERSIVVGTTRDALRILSLKPAGKNEMTAEAFLAGYKHLFRY